MIHQTEEMRPKLKQDSVFLQTPEGVFLQSDDAMFLLKGKSTYQWISALSPYMTGEHTLNELCNDLTPDQQAIVSRLVDTLLQRGVIKSHIPEPEGLLANAVLEHFHPQIEFIDHYVDRPIARFKAFRESRILLIGSGESLLALAKSLLSNGVKEIFLSSLDEPTSYIQALETEACELRQEGIEIDISANSFDLRELPRNMKHYDIIAYCTDSSSLKDVLDLQQCCMREGKSFLPAIIFGGQAILGPLVEPTNGPCWLCAQMRFTANTQSNRSAALWRSLVVGNDFSSQNATLFTPIARRLGNGLGFELFKIIAGHLPPDTKNGMIFQNLETLESYQSKVSRHPSCPICSHITLNAAEQQTLEIVSEKHDCGQISNEELQRRTDPLLDSYSGIFYAYTDDPLTQVPLKTSRLKVATPTASLQQFFEVIAFNLETVIDARLIAFKEAVRSYTHALADRRSMIVASLNELEKRGEAAVAAPRLSTWSGTVLFDRDASHEWMPAYSFLTQRLCYVPAAVVYPHSSLNNSYMFEKTTAGSGAETNFRELFTKGIISSFGYEQIQEVARGRRPVIKLKAEALEDINVDLTFLLRSAKHFERPFALLEVTSASPLYTIIAYTTDTSTASISAIGLGLSSTEAAINALTELIGRLQFLKYEGHVFEQHEQFFPEFFPRSDLAYATPAASRIYQPAFTIQQLENDLREMGRDMLFVNTTTADIWESETFISGTVLLTRATD